MRKVLFCMLVFLIAVSLYSQNAEQEIQRILQIQQITRNTSWTPAITSISRLSNKEVQKMCGLNFSLDKRVEKPQLEQFGYNAKGYVNFQDQMPAVRNQGHCGSCWAFGMTACIEWVNIKNGLADKTIDLSEQQLVSCCNKANGCNGGYIGSTGKWVIDNKGLVEEKEYSYVSGQNGEVPACNTPGTKRYTVSKVKELGLWIFPASTAKMKKVLDEGYVIDTGMKVYEDFKHYKSGVYEYVSGELLGGHAVTIVGYDDSQQCFIVRNSWGKNWGENGYFRIRYGNSSIGSQAAYVK